MEIHDSIPAAVKTMLTYIYTGQVTDDIGGIVEHVLDLANKYDLQGLKTICEKILLDDLIVENSINTFILVDRNGDCIRLVMGQPPRENQRVGRGFILIQLDKRIHMSGAAQTTSTLYTHQLILESLTS